MIGILIGGRIPPGQKSCFKRTIPIIENLWCSSLFPFQFHISHFVWPNQEIHVFAKNFDQLLSCFGWKNIWGVTFMTMLLVSSMSFGRLMAMPTKFHLASRWVTRHILVPGCHLPRFPVERGNAREGSVEPLSFGRVFYNRSNKTRRHNWVAGGDQQFDTEASDVTWCNMYTGMTNLQVTLPWIYTVPLAASRVATVPRCECDKYPSCYQHHHDWNTISREMFLYVFYLPCNCLTITFRCSSLRLSTIIDNSI